MSDLARAFALFVLDLARSGGGDGMPDGAHVPDCVATLVGDNVHRSIGTCDRCGKRAPLQPVGIPHGEEKHACAWGCAAVGLDLVTAKDKAGCKVSHPTWEQYLHEHDLFVVTAADKAVLDAVAMLPLAALEGLVRAELARREAAKCSG